MDHLVSVSYKSYVYFTPTKSDKEDQKIKLLNKRRTDTDSLYLSIIFVALIYSSFEEVFHSESSNNLFQRFNSELDN